MAGYILWIIFIWRCWSLFSSLFLCLRLDLCGPTCTYLQTFLARFLCSSLSVASGISNAAWFEAFRSRCMNVNIKAFTFTPSRFSLKEKRFFKLWHDNASTTLNTEHKQSSLRICQQNTLPHNSIFLGDFHCRTCMGHPCTLSTSYLDGSKWLCTRRSTRQRNETCTPILHLWRLASTRLWKSQCNKLSKSLSAEHLNRLPFLVKTTKHRINITRHTDYNPLITCRPTLAQRGSCFLLGPSCLVLFFGGGGEVSPLRNWQGVGSLPISLGLRGR